MLTAHIYTMGFKPMSLGLLRHMIGVALACLVLLEIAMGTQAAGVSQLRDDVNVYEVKRARNPGLQHSLSHLLLQLQKRQRSHNLPGKNSIIIRKGPSSQFYPPASHSAKETEQPKRRVKRWDFRTDGCHCDGYKLECMHDSTCRQRHRNMNWKCSHTCCGFQCVRDRHRSSQSNNATMPSSHKNATTTTTNTHTSIALNTTTSIGNSKGISSLSSNRTSSTSHSSFLDRIGTWHNALHSLLNNGNKNKDDDGNSTSSSGYGRIASMLGQDKSGFGEEEIGIEEVKDYNADDDDDDDEEEETEDEENDDSSAVE